MPYHTQGFILAMVTQAGSAQPENMQAAALQL
jgi:hypothetical protein